MLSTEILRTFEEELSNPVLDDYTVAVLARRHLAAGDVAGAMARLRVDNDKFRMVAPLLSQIVTKWFEDRATNQAQWTSPLRQPSSGEQSWLE